MLNFTEGFFLGSITSLTLFYIGLVFHKCDALPSRPGDIIPIIRKKAFGANTKKKPIINDDEAAYRREKEEGDKNG